MNGQIQIEILNAVQQLRMTFNNRIKTLTVCDLNSKTTHDNVAEKLRRELYTLLFYVNESDPRSNVHYLGSSENKA